MKKRNRIISMILCLIFILCTNSPCILYAKSVLTGYLGDNDNDMNISASDLKIMISYMFGKNISSDISKTDLNNDDYTNIADLVLLKSCVIGQSEWKGIYEEQDDVFLDQITREIEASLPSHGKVDIPVFCVDFQDCRFSEELSCETLEKNIFGPQNEQSSYYPFESISAFFGRTSKGSLELSGKVYKYTAKYPISYYSEDIFKTDLTTECISALDDIIDFNDYDSNHDGCVDGLIFTVPESADDEYWWPNAGYFGDSYFQADGLTMGHDIIGNECPSSISKFNSAYSHELGHCFGLPDYYLYNSYDSEGLHGPAGTEMMDTDACYDFSAVSKLMLGWYKEDQTEFFDFSEHSVSYTLYNAQSDHGNCIIIPRKAPWNPVSEFLIIEYQTETANNHGVDYVWWQDFSEGVRIYHANTDISYNGWWYYFTYEESKPEGGTRFIRLVNDGKPAFIQGAMIDNSVNGFGWYDSQGKESVDPGISLNINSIDADKCSLTITSK